MTSPFASPKVSAMAYREFGSWSGRRVCSSSRVTLAVVVAFMVCGCSGSDSPGTGGGGGASSGGASGSAGGPASSGLCPSAIPAQGDACSGVGSCVYRDCAGRGVVSASCNGSQIGNVQTFACTATSCGDTSCPVGTICVSEFSSDASSTTRCVSDPCGTGPTGCDYACYAKLCSAGLMCYSSVAGGRSEVACQAP